MKYEHRCSLDWLKARQDYITASEIHQMLPFTATGRKRSESVQDENLLKVIAGKQKILTEDDCLSFGAAARGHILEPFAIDEFNKLGYDDPLYHWDDSLITLGRGSLAFSPDALGCKQDMPDIELPAIDFAGLKLGGEVKSYSIDKHIGCGIADRMTLEERWQIATAFAICENLERYWLIFFNPSCEYRMFVHAYTRHDLEEEVRIIKETEIKARAAFIEKVSLMLDMAEDAEGPSELEILNATQNVLNP